MRIKIKKAISQYVFYENVVVGLGNKKGGNKIVTLENLVSIRVWIPELLLSDIRHIIWCLG